MSGEKSTQQNESQSSQINLAPICAGNNALPPAFVTGDLQQNADGDFVFGNTARSLKQRTQRRGGNDTDSLPDLEIAIKPTTQTHNNVPMRCKDDLSAMMMMEKQFLEGQRRRSSGDGQLRKSNSAEMKPNPGTKIQQTSYEYFQTFLKFKALEKDLI